MSCWAQQVLDWSEVWAGLMPCAILLYNKQPPVFRPVVCYVWLSLLINIAIDLIWKLGDRMPQQYHSNNFLYNLLSIVRFFLFSSFFVKLQQPFLVGIKLLIILSFTLFVIVDFSLSEDFFNFSHFSSRLLSVEAFCLLFFVMQYYIYELKRDEAINIFTNQFWVVTGLGVYVSINFFVFLLYNRLSVQMQRFAASLWNLHNLSFILFNMFLVRGFYGNKR